MISRLYCIDEVGLEGLLTDGQIYRVRRMACGAVKVSADDGSRLTCAGSRFSKVYR